VITLEDNYGLLIASLVAIVAVVGLVILFSGTATGAIPSCPYYCATPGGPGAGAFLCSDVPCTQIPDPFWTVQEANARRQAIAWGGFDTV